MKVFLIFLFFAASVLCMPYGMQAAFVIRNVTADTAVAPSASLRAATPDKKWRGFGEEKSTMSRVAFGLAMGSFLGSGIVGLLAVIGVFAAAAPALLNGLIVALMCVGVAGFILGIIALARGEPEKRLAKFAVIYGGVIVFALLMGPVMALLVAPK